MTIHKMSESMTVVATKEEVLQEYKGQGVLNVSFFCVMSPFPMCVRMPMKVKHTGLVFSLFGSWEPGVSL